MDTTLNTHWTAWEPAPAGRFPHGHGPLLDSNGQPLHGVWGTPADEGATRIVLANHGWALAEWLAPTHWWRCASPLLRVSNAALPHLPWVWGDGDRVRTSEPPDAAIGLVVRGRKPAAQAETFDAGRARKWLAAAGDAGLAFRHSMAEVECPPDSPPLHVVSVARREQFGQLFDLDALLGDFVAGGVDGELLTELAVEAALVEQVGVADLLHPGRCDAAGEELGWTNATSVAELLRVRLALGHHPALITAGFLGLASARHMETNPSVRAAGQRHRASMSQARSGPLPGLPKLGHSRTGAQAVRRWGGAV